MGSTLLEFTLTTMPLIAKVAIRVRMLCRPRHASLAIPAYRDLAAFHRYATGKRSVPAQHRRNPGPCI